MQDLIARLLILKVKILDSTIKGGTRKGTSLKYNRAPPYGVPFGPCLKTRKKRLSTEEIIDYINWALINDNMKMIKNNSLVFVQKSYKEQTGRDVSITFIRNQKIKMFKCNNGVPH